MGRWNVAKLKQKCREIFKSFKCLKLLTNELIKNTLLSLLDYKKLIEENALLKIKNSIDE